MRFRAFISYCVASYAWASGVVALASVPAFPCSTEVARAAGVDPSQLEYRDVDGTNVWVAVDQSESAQIEARLRDRRRRLAVSVLRPDAEELPAFTSLTREILAGFPSLLLQRRLCLAYVAAKNSWEREEVIDEMVARFDRSREFIESELENVHGILRQLNDRERLHRIIVDWELPAGLGVDRDTPTASLLRRLARWKTSTETMARRRAEYVALVQAELEVGDGRYALRVAEAREKAPAQSTRADLESDITLLERRIRAVESELSHLTPPDLPKLVAMQRHSAVQMLRQELEALRLSVERRKKMLASLAGP